MNPMISVIIPTYNRKEMLEEAIESVLMQSYKNLEIILIDDCSTDGTQEWVEEKYRNNETIKYTRNEINRNAGISRNFGYKQSQGDYLVFLDDDDLYTDKDFFQKAITVHQSDDYAFVSAKANGQPLTHKGRVKKEEFLQGFQREVRKPHATFTTLFKKTNLESIDFENMRMMNDEAIYMRALLTGDPYLMEDFVGTRRVHGANRTYELDFLLKNLDEKMWVCKEAMDRNFSGIGYEWIVNQTQMAICDYISFSKPDGDSRQTLYLWVRANLPKREAATRLLVLKIGTKGFINRILGRRKR